MCYKPKEILWWFQDFLWLYTSRCKNPCDSQIWGKIISKLVIIVSRLSFFCLHLRYTASFVPMVFSSLSRKINMQISVEGKHDFWSHLCKSSYNFREINSGTPAFHLCKWHLKLCCVNLLERGDLYRRSFDITFLSSCNLHVCLWIYKALMGGAETAWQLVRSDPLQGHIQLGQQNLSVWHLLVTHSRTVHHPL